MQCQPPLQYLTRVSLFSVIYTVRMKSSTVVKVLALLVPATRALIPDKIYGVNLGSWYVLHPFCLVFAYSEVLAQARYRTMDAPSRYVLSEDHFGHKFRKRVQNGRPWAANRAMTALDASPQNCESHRSSGFRLSHAEDPRVHWLRHTPPPLTRLSRHTGRLVARFGDTIS